MATNDDAWEFLPPSLIEFKLLDVGATVDGPPGSFTGYLASYGNLDDNNDVLMSGAFGNSLHEYHTAGELPPLWLNHAGIPWGAVTPQSLLPIGVWTNMQEDAKGIHAKGQIDPMDTDLGKQIYAGMKNKSVKGLSVGFKALKFTRGTKAEEPRRSISEAKLFEGSIVWMPANPLAGITSVKSSMIEVIEAAKLRAGAADFDVTNVRHLDVLLREAGMSRSEAKSLLAHGFKSVANPRDAGAAGALDELLAELRSVKQSVT